MGHYMGSHWFAGHDGGNHRSLGSNWFKGCTEILIGLQVALEQSLAQRRYLSQSLNPCVMLEEYFEGSRLKTATTGLLPCFQS